MIANLREAKAKLSALVASAEGGEDVVITVRGQPAARLSAVRHAPGDSMSHWESELRSLHGKYGSRKHPAGSQAILDSLREERG